MFWGSPDSKRACGWSTAATFMLPVYPHDLIMSLWVVPCRWLIDGVMWTPETIPAELLIEPPPLAQFKVKYCSSSHTEAELSIC